MSRANRYAKMLADVKKTRPESIIIQGMRLTVHEDGSLELTKDGGYFKVPLNSIADLYKYLTDNYNGGKNE